jgi:Integrase core domain
MSQGKRLCRTVRAHARTEIIDRMLIFSERHLRIMMAEYARHYNGRRPHCALQFQPLRPDRPARPQGNRPIPAAAGGRMPAPALPAGPPR